MWGTDPREKKQIQIDIVGVPVQESNQKISKYLICLLYTSDAADE